MSSDRNLSEIQRGLRSFEGFFNEEKLIDDILRELFNGERIFITGIRKKGVLFGNPENLFLVLTDLRIIQYSKYGNITIFDPKDYYFTHSWGQLDLWKEGSGIAERLEMNFNHENREIFERYFKQVFAPKP
ncbi:hypothetical protein H9Q08_10345 [Chryseobacterium sp. PS-8]|uniref:YokE-like PH domain-containing protein n=1 Tax=Chryseobacterium indicum TaxID=2766954 RepID=A0ABS9C559_9FLAO|nr:hypothetical protein [Chryseobacterium sp. PS-8]MCF2219708.1 hypothetical protein [Chryseobacterium sp. PS-8]